MTGILYYRKDDGSYVEIGGAGGGSEVVEWLAPNRWYAPPGAVSTSPPTNGQMTMYPIKFQHSVTIAQLGVNFATGPAVGALYRFGFYKDSTGVPGELVADAGTVNAAVTGNAILNLFPSSIVLPKGRYWIAAVLQGNPATTGSIRTASAPTIFGVGGSVAADISSVAAPNGYIATGITGALPNPAPTPTGSVGPIPRVFFQVTAVSP